MQALLSNSEAFVSGIALFMSRSWTYFTDLDQIAL
jgi:hypothetical protein